MNLGTVLRAIVPGLCWAVIACILRAQSVTSIGPAASSPGRPWPVQAQALGDQVLRPPPAHYRTPLERRHGSRLIEIGVGTALNTIDIGREKPRTLVFVHGDAGSFDYWSPQIEHFAPAFRIVAYEREDCGRSRSASAITYSRSAENLARLLEKLGVDRYVLIGHSRGQELGAVLFASRPPGMVGFVAEGTGIAPHPSAKAQAEARTRVELHSRGVADLRQEVFQALRGVAPDLAAGMGLGLADTIDALRYSCANWRPAAGILGGIDVDIEARLWASETPMLQIDGADYRRDRDRRQTMQRFFRRARLVLVPGAAHVPHLTAKGRFNDEVDRFLRELAWGFPGVHPPHSRGSSSAGR